MSRRSRRKLASRLARGYPLDDSARRWGELESSTIYSISTGLNDSRRASPGPRPSARSFPGRSSLFSVRASMRSRWQPRNLVDVIRGKELYERALVCARRSVRKEVLFALGRSGRGSRSPRRVRREDSGFRC